MIAFFIGLLVLGSLVMLKFDYWDLENPTRQPVWDTSQLIKNNTNKSDLIISVTGGDPTLLYLANRKGWLVSPESINQGKILEWKKEGAKYIAGSWDVVESYNPFSDKIIKSNLNKLLCNSIISSQDLNKGCKNKEDSYLIYLN